MTWRFDIENIGGIRTGAAAIEPGVNAVRASNWRGKSSLIKAIEAVMGTATALTEGAERGRVELVTDDDTIEIELVRQGGNVVRRGDGYLSDQEDRVRADLFAFLDEDNEIRQAVRAGENLESVLTRPLEFERIDERIAELKDERQRVDAEYDRAVEAANQLPTVQERVERLESKLDDLRTDRDELKAGDEVAGPAASRDDLSDARAERERLENQKSQLDASIASTRDRLRSRREDLEELTVPEPADLEAEVADARDALSDLEQEIDLLQTLYNSNKRVLDAGRLDLLAEIEHGLDDDSLTCWVCGGEADRATVEARLETIADRLADRRQSADEYRTTVEEIEEERRSIRKQRREKRDLEAEIDELEATLADREESLEAVTDRLEILTDRIGELETKLEATDDRLTDIESDIKFTEAELEDAREDLETIETQADQREKLEEERSSLTNEIEELRTRKDRLKRETRAAFDDAIQSVIDELAPGFEGARLTPAFELVVAREGREASLDALSEGEVELLGIVTALAGYEAYDVADVVPVILLDSVGDLAGENLGPLVQYLGNHATFVVTTAYPEQSVAEDHIIDPKDWAVVSDTAGQGARS